MRRTVSVGRQSAARAMRGKDAVAENAAAADSTLRRENRLVTSHSLLGLLFCGERRECAGTGQAAGWRRLAGSCLARSPDAAQRAAPCGAAGPGSIVLSTWYDGVDGPLRHQLCQNEVVANLRQGSRP